VLFLVMAASPVAAQEPGRTDVRGAVIDRTSGSPLIGAYVGIAGSRSWTTTDRDGRFILKGLPLRDVTLEVTQLGYADLERSIRLTEDFEPLRIELAPDPIVLEGIRVVSDRLRARRNSIPYSVRAWDADDLATSPSFDAFDFVRSRMAMSPCPRGSHSTNCIIRRGRVVSPRVYVDDAPFLGGVDVLLGWNTFDLYAIEVIGSGAQVRVYTKAFAERLARGKARLTTIFY
jgi:iron complex outermembrane receptor protein